MPSPRQQFGQLAERAVAEWLRSQGFVVLDQHVTSRYGEIDVLCRLGKTLVAVEVRARRTTRFGSAVESVTRKKLERIEAALEDIIAKRQYRTHDIRVDVLTLEPGSLPGQFAICHYPGVGPDA